MLFFPVFAKLQPGRSPDLSLPPLTAIYAPCRLSCPITPISRLHNPFKMNTCKSVLKQTTLTVFRMNTYEKHRGWGAVMVNQLPSEFDVPALKRSDVATFADTRARRRWRGELAATRRGKGKGEEFVEASLARQFFSGPVCDRESILMALPSRVEQMARAEPRGFSTQTQTSRKRASLQRAAPTPRGPGSGRHTRLPHPMNRWSVGCDRKTLSARGSLGRFSVPP
jgi:hypothetical protein